MNELRRIKLWFEQYKAPIPNLGQSRTDKYDELSKGLFSQFLTIILFNLVRTEESCQAEEQNVISQYFHGKTHGECITS